MYTPTRVQDNYSSSYSYDLAGNLLTLTRNGFLGMDANNEPTYGLIDQLIYDYDADLFLEGVKNDISVASEDYGFKGEETGYAYDDRGNMTSSTLNGLTIDYNHINLPGGLSSDFGSQTTHYSLGGSKIMTVNQYTDPPTGQPTVLTRVYFMGMELEYEGVGNFSSTFTPKAYHFGDGRLLFDGNDTRKQYHLHDHLGNVVVVFEDKDNDGFIEETDNPNTNEIPHRYHYHSFGMLWDLPDPFTPLYSDDNRYLYNGKEFEQVANLLDYGWRWYDPVVGRWNGVDPLADHPNQIHISPFAYAWNNPILLIDPDGLCPNCENNVLKLYAYPYQQVGGYIGSAASYVGNSLKSAAGALWTWGNNYFSPGEAQQHTGENWIIMGKGSNSGWDIPAPLANPDGETRIIDGIFDIISPGTGGSNALRGNIGNRILEFEGMNDNVNYLNNQINRNQNSGNSTNGYRAEIEPKDHGWIGELPEPGQRDTIINPDGTKTERFRLQDGGGRIFRNID